MEAKTIIFIGPQGSGKGTQVANLIDYLKSKDDEPKVVEVQTGRGFRELVEGEGYTASRIKDIIDHGGLVPDFLTESIVTAQLIYEVESDSTIIMDGFPRNLEQAQFVDDLLSFYLRDKLSVIYLDTPDEVVKERMLSRGRKDDTEESIKERLRLYEEMTKPLIDHYKSRPDTDFIKIDGAKTVEEVQADIRAGLKI